MLLHERDLNHLKAEPGYQIRSTEENVPYLTEMGVIMMENDLLSV